jgi:hypothetical protein
VPIFDGEPIGASPDDWLSGGQADDAISSFPEGGKIDGKLSIYDSASDPAQPENQTYRLLPLDTKECFA